MNARVSMGGPQVGPARRRHRSPSPAPGVVVEEGWAGTVRGLIPEDLVHFRWVEEVAVNPDGRHVAYTVRRPRATLDGYEVAAYLVEVDQAGQLFAALRWLGREVELVWFCGESHLFHQGGTPVNRTERLRRLLGWFQRHLGAEPIPRQRSGDQANGG